jgi:hypothetical protein
VDGMLGLGIHTGTRRPHDHIWSDGPDRFDEVVHACFFNRLHDGMGAERFDVVYVVKRYQYISPRQRKDIHILF